MMDFVQQTVSNNILTLTINRPKALNALNAAIMDELQMLFVEKEIKAGAINGVIITGSGEKAFIAGADIKEFTNLNASIASSLSRKGHQIFRAIECFPVPVIAAINGFALGGGCELAMACHLRIASDTARFGLPEVSLGLIPGYAGTQRLPKLVGKGRALEMILSGKMIDANTALSFGLVNKVVKPDLLLSEANEWLSKIIANGPLAIEQAIRAVDATYDQQIDGPEFEIEAFGYLTETQDFKEGVSAFMEKRKPSFKGK